MRMSTWKEKKRLAESKSDANKTNKEKERLLELGSVWWWESNRMIPINIFLREDMKNFNYCLLTMNSKDVKVTIGPVTNINNLTVKRVKRKSVQLVRKPM